MFPLFIYATKSHYSSTESSSFHGHLDERGRYVVEPKLQVVSVAHSHHVAVPLVEPNARCTANPVPQNARDHVPDHTIPRNSDSAGVSFEDNVMARRLVVVFGHPEPHGGLEGYDWVGSYQFRLRYQIQSKCLTRNAVVEVAAETKKKKKLIYYLIINCLESF